MNSDDLRKLMQQKISTSPSLRSLMKRIQSGKATFRDTAEYSRIYSELLGKCLSDKVLSLDDREAAAADILRDSFDHTNSILSQVQTNIDKKNGINIRPQTADFPLERVQQFSHSLTDPTVPDETIQRRARNGTANISMSFHDDYMSENAVFRSNAGLRCYIDRQTDGKCCKWCTAIAGRYVYGEEPHDVYRRHDNCGCSVIYENGRQRQDVWSKRTWEKPKVGAGAPPPTKFTPEQARVLEQEKMSQYQGLIQNQNYSISAKQNSNAYSVDRNLVNSKAYHDKFEDLTPHKAANESIYQQSKRLLEHRDGHFEESLIVIDSRTGKVITDNFDNTGTKYKTGLTEEQYKLVQEQKSNFIMMHNHPDSVRPSGTDIITLWKEKRADASVIVGHDGTIFMLSEINRKIPIDKIYNEAYNEFIEKGFPKEFAAIKATDKLYETNAFVLIKR